MLKVVEGQNWDLDPVAYMSKPVRMTSELYGHLTAYVHVPLSRKSNRSE